MSRPPFFAEIENLCGSSLNPSGVTVSNTQTAAFFRRHLLQRAISTFEWKLPDYWSREYFLYTLFGRGHIGVVNTDKYGPICQWGSPYGLNVFYMPNRYVIANPLLKGMLNPVIGEQCEVIRFPDWRGVMDIVTVYADYMALAAQACGVNLINSKLAYILTARNKAHAETLKKMYDEVASGKPVTVVDSSAREGEAATINMLSNNLTGNFITPQLLDAWRTIENMFDTAIGIPNANTTKRARLNVDEVNANNVEVYSTASEWLEGWKLQCEKVRKMFDIDISVDWRFPPVEMSVDNVDNEGGEEDAQS